MLGPSLGGTYVGADLAKVGGLRVPCWVRLFWPREHMASIRRSSEQGRLFEVTPVCLPVTS